MSGIPEGVPVDDRTALERLLEQWEAEKYVLQRQVVALQGRLNALARAADGVRALLDFPEPEQLAFDTEIEAARAAELAYGRIPQHRAPTAQGSADEAPKGKEAAKLVLQSDTSRFWPVRAVSDDEIRRGWAEPRPRGTKGNPPARIALQRLHEQYPQNVEVTTTPVLAYRWNPDPSPSPNGSGASHVEGEIAERAL